MFTTRDSIKSVFSVALGLALLAPQARADEPKNSNPPAKKAKPATPAKDTKKVKPATPAKDTKKVKPATPAKDTKKVLNLDRTRR